MFNFLKTFKMDVRDDAIMEILHLMIVHANIVLENKDGDYDNKMIALSAAPMIALGDLESLKKYLKESPIPQVREIEKVIAKIAKVFEGFDQTKEEAANGN